MELTSSVRRKHLADRTRIIHTYSEAFHVYIRGRYLSSRNAHLHDARADEDLNIYMQFEREAKVPSTEYVILAALNVQKCNKNDPKH